MPNDLESIIDEELLSRFKSIRKTNALHHNEMLSKPKIRFPSTTRSNFKVELMCSQKFGIRGQLPVGMNH